MVSNLLKLINIKVFLISLFIGLIYMYFDNDKKKISVYPTPSNINSVEFKDKADNCFEYSMEKVKCPSNKSEINNIPIQ
jgi:hypothetical protein|tara:strand:- start:2345 stop:2581 length:237 start_codon:yes stop_codon:yes gene_type:complete